MPKKTDVRITTTVVAYTSFCDGQVTRFSSLRTSLRNKPRALELRPPVASFICRGSSLFSCIARYPHSRLAHPTLPGRDLLMAAASRTRRRSQLACLRERGWQARRESNPQPPVLETGALPIELLAYRLSRIRHRSVGRHSVDFRLDPSGALPSNCSMIQLN